MAGLFLASPAIRSCFVDTLSGFKAPSCFSETTLFTTVPRFPRPAPPRAAFPGVNSTIRALRLPASTTGSLMYSLPRADQDDKNRNQAKVRNQAGVEHNWVLWSSAGN